jgi:hypothetical protein
VVSRRSSGRILETFMRSKRSSGGVEKVLGSYIRNFYAVEVIIIAVEEVSFMVISK